MLAKDLIDETIRQLHGYGQTRDRITTLTNAISPTDQSFTVDATTGVATGLNPGPVEIDSEQLYVSNVDQSANLITLMPGVGRGYDNSTPAAHVAGSVVISQPKFPRSRVMQAMNEVISSLYPDLFGVASYTTTVTIPQYTYTIPGAVPVKMLRIEWQDPIFQWRPVRSWTVDSFDGSIQIGSGAMVGRPLRFLYTVEPVPFVSESDDFVTQTKLPAGASDLLPLGVAVRMTPSFDISRAQQNSVEQAARSTAVPPNTGINLATYLNRQFQARLANEALSLRKQYPPQIRRVV